MQKESNLSITGEESQALLLLHKIGVALFSLGIFLLYFVFNSRGEERINWSMTAFGTMLLGAIVFTLQHNHFFRKKLFFQKDIPSVLSYVLTLFGLGIMGLAWSGKLIFSPNTSLILSLSSLALAITFQIIGKYSGHPKGIKNNFTWFASNSSRGIIGWAIGIILTLFYIQIYWAADPFPVFISMFDSLSQFMKGKPANKWFLYGTMYSFVILFLGIKFIYKYRHNRYHLIRTIVVIFSQLILAYLVPNIMEALNFDSATMVVDGKEVYQGYYNANPIKVWPLDYDAFTPKYIEAYTNEAYQPVGISYLFWGFLLFLVGTPIITYLVGKRWYCSWFCGCGGLAETAGDSYRHLSNKSIKAWKIERWLIHGVMVFVLLMSIGVLWPYLSKKEFSLMFFTLNLHGFFWLITVCIFAAGWFLFTISKKQGKQNRYITSALVVLLIIQLLMIMAYLSGSNEAFILSSKSMKSAYGFFIGSTFSGVIGVGFYPILGNRVWCRFGCPMAGYMGIIQRFKSRFRITTNGGQCISCGNCSTYCEQGIDVRAYAQKGQNIVRASCVGCGVCSAVCPRGVLKLENGPEEGRIQDEPNLIGLIK
jgi:Pyruvate/2-oxoacid:ferredoxin oxidoreductase delta subunit